MCIGYLNGLAFLHISVLLDLPRLRNVVQQDSAPKDERLILLGASSEGLISSISFKSY